MSDPDTTSSSDDESPLPTKRAAYIVESEEEEEEEEKEKERTPEPTWDDDDDWGSVAAASDRDEEGEEGDWGSVEAASEEPEEGAEKDDDDDWGYVVASSDREEEDVAAVEGDSGDDEVPIGEEEGHIWERQVGEEEVEEEEEEEEEAESWQEEDSTKSLLEIAAAQSLPTPEQSDAPPATRSRFLRSASRKFRAESASGRPPPRLKVKGRRRGPQINPFTKEYLDLLNSEIRLAAARETYSTTEKFQLREGSSVLGSWWTPEEKEVFFNHLAVLGKDRLDQIAKAVRTKTVVECAAYLQILHKGLEESHRWVRSRKRDTVGMEDIPAAVELSEDCVDALDKQAKLLQDRVIRDEEIQEKRQWGEFWLLDQDVAEGITTLYNSDDMDAVHDIAPEAELLHIGNMLQLSEQYAGPHLQSPLARSLAH
jgi:hypothetical protein